MTTWWCGGPGSLCLLEFGGACGLQDEPELFTQLLGQGRGQGLVLVPHGGRRTLLDHRDTQGHTGTHRDTQGHTGRGSDDTEQQV